MFILLRTIYVLEVGLDARVLFLVALFFQFRVCWFNCFADAAQVVAVEPIPDDNLTIRDAAVNQHGREGYAIQHGQHQFAKILLRFGEKSQAVFLGCIQDNTIGTVICHE